MALEVPGIFPNWVPPVNTKVIAAGTAHRPPATAIVMCARMRPDGEVYGYVTGSVTEHTTSGWRSGHYFTHIEDAHRDYIMRIESGY